MRRTLTFLALGLILVVVALLGIDTGFAINAERSFARSLPNVADGENGVPHLPYEPEVTISGFPAIPHLLDGHYPAIGVTARAVDLSPTVTFADKTQTRSPRSCEPDDPCHADIRARLTDVRVNKRGRSLTHPFSQWSGLKVAKATTSTTLDSVAVGRLLGITDLTVSTPAPPGTAGGGGPQDGLLSRTSGIVLTGTVQTPPPDERDVKVSVTVDLAARGTSLTITATGFYDGPEEHSTAVLTPDEAKRVLGKFSATIGGIPMAWGATATSARSSGSDLMIEGTPDPEYTQSPSLFLSQAGDVHFMYTCGGKPC
ncbi:DUF2993 domain-containing protein [Williamsia sp.]|uniref:LmeA family phospholipid-binding protein n=1 Tax=Williamsia sp. TaxID=1872085 RepID=UPI001A35ACC4|nr:DUF2993 domain-containing protein [Williamsia sp.]MBJ7289240.1 DUF2993 domain-containing protein [Williamsia sp.]